MRGAWSPGYQVTTLPRHYATSPPTGHWPFAGLVLFLFTVYANPGNWFDGLEHVGFAKIAAGLALAALAGSWLLYGHRLRAGGWPGLALCALFLLTGFSALWSYWPRYTVDTFLDGLKYLAIFLLVVNLVDTQRRLKAIVTALAWATLIPAYGAISSWIRGVHVIDEGRVGWIGIFANPNDLAYHLVVGIAVILAAREGTPRRWLRAVYLALLVPVGVGVLLTQSRGGMLASGAVLALWVLGSMRRRPSHGELRGGRFTLPVRLAGVALAVACVFALSPGNPWSSRMRAAQYHGEDMSARGRIDAWRTGMNIASERPLTGVGAGAFMIAWPDFAPGDAGPARTIHNTYLQLLSELGLPALVLFLGAFFAAIAGTVRAAKDPELEPYARGLGCGLAGFAVCSIWLGIAFSWPLYILLGASLGAARIARRPTSAAEPVPPRRGAAAAG